MIVWERGHKMGFFSLFPPDREKVWQPAHFKMQFTSVSERNNKRRYAVRVYPRSIARYYRLVRTVGLLEEESDSPVITNTDTRHGYIAKRLMHTVGLFAEKAKLKEEKNEVQLKISS